MKHVLDALKEREPIQDTWLVVGKGPSYDPGKIMDADVPMCCLNETCNYMGMLVRKVELCLMNDRTVLNKIAQPALDTCDLFGIANGPHHFAAPEEVSVSFMAAAASNLTLIGNRLTFFDLRTCSHQAFPDHPKIQSHFSVYETALWILGYAGVKRILTSGVDGGCAYHEAFGERAEKYRNTDLTDQFARAEAPIKRFGLTVEKL